MTLIVGLGNPGIKYEKTRHNVGFLVIDELLKNQNFSDIANSKFQGNLYKISNNLFLKPQTFMNLSGNSVKSVKDFFKPDDIIVIHDDLDLPFGSLRFKFGGSSAGHNGIKSIDELIGRDYFRVRVGISHPQTDVKDYVLGKFDDEKRLEEILQKAKIATQELIKTKNLAEISSKFTIKKGFDNQNKANL